ncbi:MAG: FAD-binding oxidoreductase [Scytolyngbya sp. HA4215-MV1]|nr:FAD-binding oxidoreductase [Scytolyngbya sp. HA4215-MV1]
MNQVLSQPQQLQWLVSPHSPEALAEVVACAAQNRWKMLPCGAGSKLGWGGQVAGVDLLISTARLNRVIEHAIGDLTVTVEAGTRLADLQAVLAKAGQFLAIDPTYPAQATIGGIVATADAGSWRQRYGGVRDMLLGVSFVRSDGQLVKAGGRVVKNVAGYDLMKLFTGSYGTLGILTQLTLRVYPLPEASQTVMLTGDATAIAQASQTLLNSALTPTAHDLLSSQVVDRWETGKGMGLVLQFQGILPSVQEQVDRVLGLAQQLGLRQTLVKEVEESALWQRLTELMQLAPFSEVITCKIGVQATGAVRSLSELEKICDRPIRGRVHVGSGVGQLALLQPECSPEMLSQMRHLCQEEGGFLSVLQAPVALKQKIDVWGYRGNALDLMKTLKHQFDPLHLLSPQRFERDI